MGAALSTRKGRESKSGPTSGVVNPQHASTRHSDVHVDLNDPEVSSAVREYAVSRGLLAPEDRRSIQCDSQLRSIFGVDKLSFFHLEVSQPRAPRALGAGLDVVQPGAD